MAISKILDRAKRANWAAVLVGGSVLLFIANIISFYPGYMSGDSFSQYEQAKDIIPIGDWHPPIMVLVWKVLMLITLHASSILLFQLGLFWTAICVLAVWAYRTTGSKKLSILPLVGGILPFVFNISGVIWKDVQMAYALTLATSLLLATFYGTKTVALRGKMAKWLRYGVLVIIFALITYATILRYNALLAVVPLLYFAIKTTWPSVTLRTSVVIVAATLVGILGLSASVNYLLGAEKENPIASVMLDDIINIQSAQQLRAKQGAIFGELADIQQCATERNIPMNNYWLCANDIQRQDVHKHAYDTIRAYWVQSTLSNLLGYFTYRVETFAIFVFSPQPYVFHDGIDKNDYGYEVASKKIEYSMKLYVQDFGYRHFSFFFEPWFWLVNGVVLLWVGLKKVNRFRLPILALAMSSIAYILCYFPVVVATDYRYIYWSVIAILIAWLLFIIERNIVNRLSDVEQARPIRKV